MIWRIDCMLRKFVSDFGLVILVYLFFIYLFFFLFETNISCMQRKKKSNDKNNWQESILVKK